MITACGRGYQYHGSAMHGAVTAAYSVLKMTSNLCWRRREAALSSGGG